ncbi:HET-domain-containing protein, partial [Coniophora puteana RWD-64-598 SS2]
ALSYVWGEAQPYSTTTQNIDSYIHDGINALPLPQTILDAILTTNRLGADYLWADTLCIIQDSDDDKIHELSHMRNVYRHSYLTIIAASAHRVSEEFLKNRKEPQRQDSQALRSMLPEMTGTVSLVESDDTLYTLSIEPIHSRGWCMQEYFLPPRELIFASHTLQYRCQRSTRNIAGADYPLWVDAAEPPPLHYLRKSPKTPEETEALHKVWKYTVENYTHRSISVSGDKLIAIASLAEEFHDVIQTPYLAGLWKSTLLSDLLWHKGSAIHCFERPKEYRAPSWSWATPRLKAGTHHSLAKAGYSSPKLCGAKRRCEVASLSLAQSLQAYLFYAHLW